MAISEIQISKFFPNLTPDPFFVGLTWPMEPFLLYWMVECAMMNKYEYMKMITNMAKLCIFLYKKPGKNGTSFRLYDIIRFNFFDV